jgi:hypothetical protein
MLFKNSAEVDGASGSVVLKVLCYKLEGRGLPDEVIFLNLPNPSGCTRPWDLLSL